MATCMVYGCERVQSMENVFLMPARSHFFRTLPPNSHPFRTLTHSPNSGHFRNGHAVSIPAPICSIFDYFVLSVLSLLYRNSYITRWAGSFNHATNQGL